MDHHTPESLELEPLGPNQNFSPYDDLLPQLHRYFYLETKVIAEKTNALDSIGPDFAEERDAIDRLKTHIVSSYHILRGQETALKVTTLTAVGEFTVCSVVATALGICAYIEGSSWWTTVTSYVLFVGVFIYEVSGFVAYVALLRFRVNETDYRRWMREARSRVEDRCEEEGAKDARL